MIDLKRDAAVRPEERFLDKLFAITREARQFHHDGLDAKRDLMRKFVHDSGLRAMFTEQSKLLDTFITLSHRPFKTNYRWSKSMPGKCIFHRLSCHIMTAPQQQTSSSANTWRTISVPSLPLLPPLFLQPFQMQ